MVSALAEIRHLGCSFIVGGREDAGGRFLTLEGVLEESGLPESLRGERKARLIRRACGMVLWCPTATLAELRPEASRTATQRC